MLRFPTYLSGYAETFYYVDVEILPQDEKPKDFKTLEQLFMNYFSIGDYKLHLTQTLHECKQKAGESLVKFISNIRAICWDIDPNWDEKQVIHYVYNGMNKQAAKDIVFMNPKNMKELIKLAKRYDHANRYGKTREDEKKPKDKFIGMVANPYKREFSKTENSTSRNDGKIAQLHKMIDSLEVNDNKNFNSNRGSQERENFRRNFRENFRQNRPRYGNSNFSTVKVLFCWLLFLFLSLNC